MKKSCKERRDAYNICICMYGALSYNDVLFYKINVDVRELIKY